MSKYSMKTTNWTHSCYSLWSHSHQSSSPNSLLYSFADALQSIELMSENHDEQPTELTYLNETNNTIQLVVYDSDQEQTAEPNI